MYALDRDVRTRVVDMAGHRERTDVLEVGRVYERVGTYVAKQHVRVELVNTIERHHSIRRSCAGERYALDDVVTVRVRFGLQF